jgi:ribosomal-protein-alanine N-acetyltransferase
MSIIRPVEVGDVLSVARIEESSFSSPWETEVFLQLAYSKGRIKTSDGTLVRMRVLVHGGTTIGYVVWEEHGTHAHIMNLAVSEAQRRRGWGTKLLEDSLRFMRECGIRKVSLEVREDNAAAVGLYESSGMQESGRVDGYYKDTDAIIYVIRL